MAVVALLAAGCQGTDESAVMEQAAKEAAQQVMPVAFDAYVNKGTTRSIQTGTLSTSALQVGDAGFGVFAYYTDGSLYDPDASKPNFMYNQQISYNTSAWTYEPVKYWPNETTNGGAAYNDYLSFLAYAPFVAVNETTGLVDTTGMTEEEAKDATSIGIISLSRNYAGGDATVRNNTTFQPDKRVDLCWGVARNNFTGGDNSLTAGQPYLNITKPGLTDKIGFEFKHALAALNVQIDAYVDGTDNTNEVNTTTHIYVRSVTFEGFATRGTLNLNNGQTAPAWSNTSGEGSVQTEAVTVNDGRVDGKEAIAAAVNERPVGLNPVLVQSEPYLNADYSDNSAAVKAGVTNTAVNLFDVSGMEAGYADPASPTAGEMEATLAAPVFLIPNGVPLSVNIVYDVETHSGNLPGYLGDGRTHGSSIENNITKTLGLTLEAGKQYIVRLHLGMNSVKIDAAVTAWDEPAVQAEVEVP